MSAARQLGRVAGRVSAGRLSTNALLAVLVVASLVLLAANPTLGIGLLVLTLAIATVLSAVEMVQAYEKRALTVFGEYRGLLEPGLNIVPPFVSRTYPFDMRTHTVDVSRQEAITEDNSPVTADAVVYVRVVNAKRAFLEIEDYERATGSLAQTTLRAVLGDMELDQTLSQREEINRRIQDELAEPTDAWGVRVESVEVQEVMPSTGVQDAMEEQTSAERRRRAMILEAQGERRSAVEAAEGDRASNVIRAEGEKQAAVLSAQGDAIATVLRARASESMGERAIIERGMETLEAIGQGESTTFVLPQELTSLLGRYGKGLTGSDIADTEGLESRAFGEADRQLLGLDDVDEMLEEVSGEDRDAPADDEAVDIEIER